MTLSADTYTAQATAGDVNKGLTNHKVCSYLIDFCPTCNPEIIESWIFWCCSPCLWKWWWWRWATAKNARKCVVFRVIWTLRLIKILIKLRRLRAVTNTHRELPSVNMGQSVDEFFRYVETSTKEGKTLPNWYAIFSHMPNLDSWRF